MKFHICHWMGKEPPLRAAVKEGNYYCIEIESLEQLIGIASGHDVMVRQVEDKMVIMIDVKGKRFSQR